MQILELWRVSRLLSSFFESVPEDGRLVLVSLGCLAFGEDVALDSPWYMSRGAAKEAELCFKTVLSLMGLGFCLPDF